MSSQDLGKMPSQSSHDQSPFSSKQSFQRSVDRAEKYLPNIPRKKCEVLNSLGSKYQLGTKLQKKCGRKAKWLSEEQEEQSLDMTYTNPGRKDMYTGKIDGEKQYTRKRYLLWSLRHA